MYLMNVTKSDMKWNSLMSSVLYGKMRQLSVLLRDGDFE